MGRIDTMAGCGIAASMQKTIFLPLWPARASKRNQLEAFM